jgi:hypothetical protein
MQIRPKSELCLLRGWDAIAWDEKIDKKAAYATFTHPHTAITRTGVRRRQQAQAPALAGAGWPDSGVSGKTTAAGEGGKQQQHNNTTN